MDSQTTKDDDADAAQTVAVTVKSMMAGKSDIVVSVPTAFTVRGLKELIAEKSDVNPEKQLLLFNDNELREDDARIADYGITANCQVTMGVNMNTGVMKQNTAVIFHVPISLPNDIGVLRSTVKNLTSVKGRHVNRPKRFVENADSSQQWSSEKQLEVELTRNRMKALKRKKNKTRLLSSGAATPIDGGSVLGSRNHSPTQTPPNESSSSSHTFPGPAPPEEEREVTEKELCLFFEPMETKEQLMRLQKQKMMQPPQSLEELEQLKERLAQIEKTSCKTCEKKIPPAEQALRCRCEKLFCQKHREPKKHQCRIDYKQTGRKKINKWMPKVGDGGARKGKTE